MFKVICIVPVGEICYVATIHIMTQYNGTSTTLYYEISAGK